MQSCASNNGSLSKDAPSLNALTTRNFKCQLDSRFFAPIYKVKTGSVKKNVKLSFPVVHFFEGSIAYLKITFHFISATCSPLKKPVFPNLPSFGYNCRYLIPYEKPAVQNIQWNLGKSGNRALSMPCGQIRALSLLFLAIQATFVFKFCRFGAQK